MTEHGNKLLELEKKLAHIGQKLSAQDAADLIAEDFVEFGASGRVWNKAEIVPAIASWPATQLVLEDFCVSELSAGLCLVTYKLRKDTEGAPCTLRSSIWRFRNEKWQIVFHQGTKCSEDKSV